MDEWSVIEEWQRHTCGSCKYEYDNGLTGYCDNCKWNPVDERVDKWVSKIDCVYEDNKS